MARLARSVCVLTFYLTAIAQPASADGWASVKTAQGLRRYAVGAKLGQGSNGAVYLATHPETGRKLVLKTLITEHRWNDLTHEQRVLASVGESHLFPSAIGLGHVEAGGARVLAMELAEGHSLHEAVAGQALASGKAVRIGMQLLRATRALHAAGYKHNDLKPENVRIQGLDTTTIKVLDVGLATPISEHQPVGPGHPWAPPEQSKAATHSNAGSVGTDIWAVGANLLFMLTGKVPHDPIAALDRVPHETRVVNGAPVSLRAVIAKALHARADDRYTSAQAFLDALRPFSAP